MKAITSCRTRASISSDARDVDARAFANARRGFARHHAALGQRVGGGQFDFEPALEAALVGPDAAHLGSRVAGNHANWIVAFQFAKMLQTAVRIVLTRDCK